ncbi:hypothetical protein Nepgr_027369 [Nepenthes gracilis]|uniref:Uncharacterized protein n=1 Tax=Nepenthes gracilis TaxID=150966 RepID=A0AAD3TAD9_NEPGR|nr:hypothetical protein Nepgr_027369 [Nepenthes gracilis]
MKCKNAVVNDGPVYKTFCVIGHLKGPMHDSFATAFSCGPWIQSRARVHSTGFFSHRL